jgi:hypothetical protein
LEFYFYPEFVADRQEDEIYDEIERKEIEQLQALEKLKMIHEEIDAITIKIQSFKSLIEKMEIQGKEVDQGITIELQRLANMERQK